MATLTKKLKSFRNRFRSLLPGAFIAGKWVTLLFAKRSYLRQSGYFRSIAQGRPVRANGTAIPWMNYAIVSLLVGRLNDQLSVFEFGSGQSTLFFAARAGSVTAVEHDPGWIDIVSRRLPANAKLLPSVPFDADRYVGMLAAAGRQFDLVVVDGEERLRCLAAAPTALTPGGVILLDDATPAAFDNAIRAVMSQGFRMLDFEGLKPGSISPARTVLLYRPDNVLGI